MGIVFRTPLCALAVGALFLLGSPTTSGAVLGAADASCRDVLANGTFRLKNVLTRAQVNCHRSRARGALDSATPCTDSNDPAFPGRARVEQAVARMTQLAASGCASASAPGALGYTSCAAPCDSVVPTIATYTDVAACLVCRTRALASALVDAGYGPTPPVQGTPDQTWKCQHKHVGPHMVGYVNRRLGENRFCQNQVDIGRFGPIDCENADLDGDIKMATGKLHRAVNHCSDADLAALTSCATTVAAEQTCAFDASSNSAAAFFEEVYRP